VLLRAVLALLVAVRFAVVVDCASPSCASRPPASPHTFFVVAIIPSRLACAAARGQEA
jgi:hypothetical protein